MPLEHPDFLKNSPYYDDFSDEKNFLRVLFKPGYAVQARELTQIQTILQSQISKFADHIFKEGAKVFGGNVNTTLTNFLRVEKNLYNLSGTTLTLTSTLSDSYLNTLKINESSLYVSNDSNSSYLGNINHIDLEVFIPDDSGNYDFQNSSGSIRLIHFLNSEYSDNDDYTILFATSISGLSIVLPESILKVKNSEICFKLIEETKYGQTNINLIEPVGFATIVTVDSGIYYTNGIFVSNNRQNLCVYHNSLDGELEKSLLYGEVFSGAYSGVRLFSYPSARIGFSIEPSIIDVQEDSTLRDPASGFYNANAPGADRYTINLKLVSLAYDETSIDMEDYANSNFIQLVRIVKGKVDWLQRYTNYSEIMEMIARRTYDESGSYTVRPFTLDIKQHLRKDVYELIVENNPDDVNADLYLELNSFIWTTENDNFNPYNQSNFSNISFPVGKIVNIIPFKENDTGNIQTSENSSKKIWVQPLNSNRFIFNTSGSQVFNYKKNSNSSVQELTVSYSKYIPDSGGVYSVYDSIPGDSSKSVLNFEPGKAYVYGYELDFYSPINIDYNKGRNINSDTQGQLSTFSTNEFLGNYVVGNFIQSNLDINIDTNIDWEKLPKFELQSDEIFTLIIEKGENKQAAGLINSWSPFDISKFNTSQRKRFGANSDNEEFESVIVISDLPI